jgi:hypothetical protein
MKVWIAQTILILAVVRLNTPANAQNSPAHLKAAASKRVVTLETVLSCADDSLLKEVFKTDRYTAHFKLNALSMVLARNKPHNIDFMALASKGFQTTPLDKANLTIMPVDFSGHMITASNLPFCHDLPTARYEKIR